MKLLFSVKAKEDIGDIYFFLKKESIQKVANSFLEKIDSLGAILILNPEIGGNRYSHFFSHIKVKTYLILDFNCIVFYEYTKTEVKVFRVLNTKRDISSVLLS